MLKPISQRMYLSGHCDVALFERLESDKKIDNYVIKAILKSEPTCKLINRIPGSRLLISSLPGSTSRMHVEPLGKPRDSTSVLKALSGKLDIKKHSPSILYIIRWLLL